MVEDEDLDGSSENKPEKIKYPYIFKNAYKVANYEDALKYCEESGQGKIHVLRESAKRCLELSTSFPSFRKNIQNIGSNIHGTLMIIPPKLFYSRQT